MCTSPNLPRAQYGPNKNHYKPTHLNTNPQPAEPKLQPNLINPNPKSKSPNPIHPTTLTHVQKRKRKKAAATLGAPHLGPSHQLLCSAVHLLSAIAQLPTCKRVKKAATTTMKRREMTVCKKKMYTNGYIKKGRDHRNGVFSLFFCNIFTTQQLMKKGRENI
ncbi:hypothetical protein ES332_D09G203700v1 [Gossypium tomentosum]|uniref:Uncharacterized protein n=1 Tax=Gossypium tomentosum TaxID=34277 RepID=A0A5D2JJS4_GOSTO|nr:hypothetical protein ES332_D09G203700v1 [Gossypium tomentosum]